MPVFRRGQAQIPQWEELIETLADELRPGVPLYQIPTEGMLPVLIDPHQHSSSKPSLYEDEIAHASYVNVVVIWERWDQVPASSRGAVILEAYRRAEPEKATRVRFPVGLTYEEALKGGYLPYVVQPTMWPSDQHLSDQMKAAILSLGARSDYRGVQLRFPFRGLAENAAQDLERTFGDGTFYVIEDSRFSFGI